MFRALIIDEDVDRWFMLSGILRQNRIKTNFVTNLFAARQAVQKEAPGMLFFDCRMLERLGLKFLKYIRSNYPRIKIVMVKDQDDPVADSKLTAEPGDICISKPFNTEMVNDTIKKILR